MITSIDIADKGRERRLPLYNNHPPVFQDITLFSLTISLYQSIVEEIIEYLDFTIFQQGMLYYVLILTEK